MEICYRGLLCTKKKVTFANYLTIILIPSRKEYNIYGDVLWWKGDDYKIFRYSAIIELNEILNRHNGMMTYSQAKKILYQPNNIIYDRSNFY